jgi:hypothetical protein
VRRFQEVRLVDLVEEVVQVVERQMIGNNN